MNSETLVNITAFVLVQYCSYTYKCCRTSLDSVYKLHSSSQVILNNVMETFQK